MIATLKSVFSLLASYALLLLANGLFASLLGVRSAIEGFSSELVGVIVAGYFLGLLAGAFLAVRVVAGVGHIRAFAAFASVMSVSALLHVLWVDPVAWFFFRMGGGFCMAGMTMVAESWLNERCTNQTRGQVMSMYMITNYFAAGIGQFILPLGDPASYELFSVASIVFSLALVPVLLTRASAPRPAPPDRLDVRALWRTSPLGLLGAFGAGLVNSTFYGLGAVFAQAIGLTLAATSTFMAAAIFGGLLLQWPVGRLSDRFDRRWVLVGVTLATSLMCLGIVLSSSEPGRALFVFAVLYGGFSFTVYSLCAAHTNDFADPDKLAQTAGGLLVAYGLGAFVGPLAAGLLMGQVGPAGMFMWSGLVSLLLGSFAFYRMRKRASKGRPERRPLITLPGGQYTSGVLYNELRNQMDRDLARMATGGFRR